MSQRTRHSAFYDPGKWERRDNRNFHSRRAEKPKKKRAKTPPPIEETEAYWVNRIQGWLTEWRTNGIPEHTQAPATALHEERSTSLPTDREQ